MEKAIEQTVSHPPASSTVASMSTTVSGNVLDLEGRAVIKVEDSSPTTVVESPHKAQRSVQIFYWMVYESAFEKGPYPSFYWYSFNQYNLLATKGLLASFLIYKNCELAS